jgi:hypothetical protein
MDSPTFIKAGSKPNFEELTFSICNYLTPNNVILQDVMLCRCDKGLNALEKHNAPHFTIEE